MMNTMMKTVAGRDISAMLNPRLAVLVTCCDSEGKPNVLTVAWHTPLSHRPPLVGISIAPTRYSHRLIQDVGEFVINIVGHNLLQAVRICGKYTGELDDKLAIAGLETCPAEKVHPPVLADAFGSLECRVIDQVETGDHTLFVGNVLVARAREDCFSNAWGNTFDDAPLQCLQRDRYGACLNLKKNGHD